MANATSTFFVTFPRQGDTECAQPPPTSSLPPRESRPRHPTSPLKSSRPLIAPLASRTRHRCPLIRLLRRPEAAALTTATTPSLSPGVNTPTTQVKGAGDCSNPVGLRRRVTDTRTGEITSSDFQKRCGTRIESKCASCSALYRGDAFQVIRSGLIDPQTKLPKLVTMVTLTAPGADRFGKTHSRRLSQDGKARRCSCRRYHNANDPLLGTPIDPSTYDYKAAASFNANASRLFAVTIQKLSRILGRKLQVVRVVEFQTRGLVHIHALVLGPVTQKSLELVVRGGINLRSGRNIAAATSNGWTWGNECKADVINATKPERAIGYLVKVVKYALKDTGNGACSHYDHGNKMSRAAEKDLKCDNSIFQCKHGVRRKIGYVKSVDETTGKITVSKIPFAFVGSGTKSSCRRHRRAGEGWGFRGHVLAKSRNWGCTFREVRERRQKWAHGNKPQPPAHLIVSWERLRAEPGTSTAPGNSPP